VDFLLDFFPASGNEEEEEEEEVISEGILVSG